MIRMLQNYFVNGRCEYAVGQEIDEKDLDPGLLRRFLRRGAAEKFTPAPKAAPRRAPQEPEAKGPAKDAPQEPEAKGPAKDAPQETEAKGPAKDAGAALTGEPEAAPAGKKGHGKK